MNAAETRKRWREISLRADQMKDSPSALPALFEAYRSLSPPYRAAADGVIAATVESADEAERFDALALVREFKMLCVLRGRSGQFGPVSPNLQAALRWIWGLPASRISTISGCGVTSGHTVLWRALTSRDQIVASSDDAAGVTTDPGYVNRTLEVTDRQLKLQTKRSGRGHRRTRKCP